MVPITCGFRECKRSLSAVILGYLDVFRDRRVSKRSSAHCDHRRSWTLGSCGILSAWRSPTARQPGVRCPVVPLGPVEDMFPPHPTRSIIGQITFSLGHLADMLHYIDEYYDDNHHLWVACTDSFLLDFRMLYYFLLENRRQGTDAHRFDFLDIKAWQRPKTDATKRMAKLADFISKHRAHLSKSRFVPEYQGLEEVLGVKRLTAEYLGRVLLDYLDVLDDFIEKLPDTRESGKRAWLGAAGSARYKTEVALGLRESDYPESCKPLMSVAARGETR
jgi:hypothetical protein